MALVDANRIVEERVNIVDVVRRHVKLQQTGRRYVGLCPFHKEKTPSFSVNEERQFYHCFGCGAHGNAITFLMMIESLSFREAVRKIGSEFGVRELLEETTTPAAGRAEEERRLIIAANRLAALFFHRKLATAPQVSSYLESRGVTSDAVKRFGLGWVGDGDELVSFLRSNGVSGETMERGGLARIDASGRIRSFFYNRIMIPVVNQRRQVIGFGGRILGDGEPKYLNTPETPVFSKRSSLFGINLVREGLKEHRYIIVTEGYFDVISLHVHGFSTAVAALGTAVTEEHLALLERFGVPVVMLLDGDAAGRAAMRRVLELKRPEKMDLRAAFIESGDEKEDPDSLVRRPDGRRRIEEILSGARRDILQHYLADLTARVFSADPIPEREAAKIEMARLLRSVLPYRREEYLGFVEKVASTHSSVKAGEAKQLVRHLQDLMRKEQGGLARGGRSEDAAPDRKGPEDDPAAGYRELLLVVATHPVLIPALDSRECAFLGKYDKSQLRAALLAAHDADDAEALRAVIERLSSDGEEAAAFARMDDTAARRRFHLLLLNMRIADIDRTVSDLSSDGSPEAIAEIQRLKQEKKRLRETLIENTTGK